MKVIITVTKVIDSADAWGLDDFVEDSGFDSDALIEFVQEDISEFLEGAKWNVDWGWEEKE